MHHFKSWSASETRVNFRFGIKANCAPIFQAKKSGVLCAGASGIYGLSFHARTSGLWAKVNLRDKARLAKLQPGWSTERWILRPRSHRTRSTLQQAYTNN